MVPWNRSKEYISRKTGDSNAIDGLTLKQIWSWDMVTWVSFRGDDLQESWQQKLD